MPSPFGSWRHRHSECMGNKGASTARVVRLRRCLAAGVSIRATSSICHVVRHAFFAWVSEFMPTGGDMSYGTCPESLTMHSPLAPMSGQGGSAAEDILLADLEGAIVHG